MKRLLFFLLVAVFVIPAAHGQIGNLDERLIDLPTSPVHITNMHFGKQPPAWASEAHRTTPVPADLPVLPAYFQVQNPGQQTAFAYSIMIVTYDPFGNYLDSARAIAVTSLAPQVADYGRWSMPVRFPDAAWTVLVYIEAVRFQDGSVWMVDPATVAAFVPGTAPVRFHSWHIMPDPREVLPIKMKDAG